MVDGRIDHALPDPRILARPVAVFRDLDLVPFVVAPGVVVVDHTEQRRAVVDRGPDRARIHCVVAVAEDRHAKAAGIARRDRGADGRAWAVADAASAVVTEIVAAAGELPDAFRKARLVADRELPLLVFDGVVNLGHQPGRCDRLAVPVFLDGFALSVAQLLVAFGDGSLPRLHARPRRCVRLQLLPDHVDKLPAPEQRIGAELYVDWRLRA